MAGTQRILIADDDDSLRGALEMLLSHAGYDVTEASNRDEALRAVKEKSIDLALLDLRFGKASGLELIPEMKRFRPEMSLVMITALGSIETAVEAMRLGADNYVTKPVEPPSLLALVAKGLEARALRRKSSQYERLSRTRPSGGAKGSSAEWTRAVELARSVAGRETTVLFHGETGSGKGILARFVHDSSPRAREPFVELNCAGLQKDLVESELFGHEKGAFSGAVERKIGLFEAADGGTLFLDEIGEMELSVQAKLLKAIESRRFRRLGGLSEVDVDVRLLAATHRDLQSEVSAGRFREDLYYRLAIFEIEIPPLRARGRDVLELAESFLAEFRGGAGSFSAEAGKALLGYDWPGNVRELRNVVERAAILAPPDSSIELEHLPVFRPRRAVAPSEPDGGSGTIHDAEKRAVVEALAANGGNLVATAKALGVSRGTLYRKLKKYGLASESAMGLDDGDAG